MATATAEVGDEVRIRFLDHCTGGDEPCEFFVYGRIFLTKRFHYVVDVWCYPDITDPDRSDNVDRFSILKSTISEIVIYSIEAPARVIRCDRPRVRKGKTSIKSVGVPNVREG